MGTTDANAFEVVLAAQFAAALGGTIFDMDAGWGTGTTQEARQTASALLATMNQFVSQIMQAGRAITNAGGDADAAFFMDLATTMTDHNAELADELQFGMATAITGANLEEIWNALDGTDERGGFWFQVGANSEQGVILNIGGVSVSHLNAGSENHAQVGFEFEVLHSDEGGLYGMTGEDINRFLDAIDAALAHVTRERSNLGAMQNRLEFTIENLDISSENLSDANSRIRDADMAQEMMRLTQANVLQQAAISMLAQANQAPQSVLQLLG